MAETSWRRSPTTATGAGFEEGDGDSPLFCRCPHPLDRFGHNQVHEHRLAGRCLLGLDAAEIEKVVDDAADPEGLGMDAAGQRWATSASGSDTRVSASNPSAPIGS